MNCAFTIASIQNSGVEARRGGDAFNSYYFRVGSEIALDANKQTNKQTAILYVLTSGTRTSISWVIWLFSKCVIEKRIYKWSVYAVCIIECIRLVAECIQKADIFASKASKRSVYIHIYLLMAYIYTFCVLAAIECIY